MSTKKKEYVNLIMQSGEQMGVESVAFHAIAAGKVGLHLSDMKALSILQRRGPLASNKLAELCNLTPGAITSMVDRLVARGFARRTSDTDDARRVLVELDEKKMYDVRTLYSPMINHMTRLIESFDEHELKIIQKYQQSTVELMREEAYNLYADSDTAAVK